ncbi:ornithine cyclodeaminase family protein [Oscillospiraceae bacterium OttesenSCG-928-G22]|nr:ornithine cyclodeaminase family protein [Oscillospiraceae bacterium OttesenSCG-928-G22]
MRLLSDADLMEIVSYDDMLSAIERAYGIYERGEYYMPHRFHVDHDGKNLLYMPCFADGVFGTKHLTLIPENSKKGLPTLDGLMLLNDEETGVPLCLMDGKTLTALRTGAVGGVAIRHTTPDTVKTVGLVGAGAQGLFQMFYATRVRKFETVYVFDAYKKDLSEFIARLRAAIPEGIAVRQAESAADLLERSDVVVTATTATAPVLPDDAALLRGKHFVGIGSYKPHMREFPDALYSLVDRVYVDADVALAESGDLIQPIDAGLLSADRLTRFSRYLSESDAEKDRLKSGTTFFKSVGIAIFDIVAAKLLFEAAKGRGIGREM